MITAKIDVTKIEKARLFKGEKGTYLDIVLIDTPNGQYGNYMIVQSVTKEEREKGIKGPILGNGKTVGGRKADQQERVPAQQNRPAPTGDDLDVPF